MASSTTTTCNDAVDGICNNNNVPTPSQPPIEHIFENVVFAGGKIGPLINQISITADNIERAMVMISQSMHPIDIIFLFLIGFLFIPFSGALYNIYYADSRVNHPYKSSYVYGIARVISEAARIAIFVYIIDCSIVLAIGFGIHTYNIEKASHVLAKIVYIAWGATRLSQFKRYILSVTFTRHPDKLGRISIIDRLMDGAIILSTGMILLELLDMEMGVGIKSMFAFGSASTLVIGLASKDLATMFVNGLALSTTNRINEGDDIRFGDGTAGIVIKIGWIHTIIRNPDNLLEVVPNSQLGMQRVKNLSRIDQCRIQQNLRFHYKDIDVLPTVLKDIINEIKISCPTVITDGSRPLRAVFVNYKEDYLQVQVTAHFHCKPIGQLFYNTQQECLFAMNRAVQKNNIQFVTTFYPTIPYEPLNK